MILIEVQIFYAIQTDLLVLKFHVVLILLIFRY
jgi:hypothetical protein